MTVRSLQLHSLVPLRTWRVPLGCPAHPRTWASHRASIPLAYLAVITIAEYLTAAVNVEWGLPLHGLLFLALFYHGAVTRQERLRPLLWSLTIAPLIRIMSLSLPLGHFAIVYWFLIVSLPVFITVGVAITTLGYSRREIGLTLPLRRLPFTLLMLPLGIMLGIPEYSILTPLPLARTFTLDAMWAPALILGVCTGFEEELLFRGLLQRAGEEWLSPLATGLYVTLLFTVLHIGYLSIIDLLFVFLVGGFFAIYSRWEGSIAGATLCHTGVNLGLFLVWPFLLPAVPS